MRLLLAALLGMLVAGCAITPPPRPTKIDNRIAAELEKAPAAVG